MTHLSIPEKCWVCTNEEKPMFATFHTISGTTLYACSEKCYKAFNSEMRRREIEKEKKDLEKQDDHAEKMFLSILVDNKPIPKPKPLPKASGDLKDKLIKK